MRKSSTSQKLSRMLTGRGEKGQNLSEAKGQASGLNFLDNPSAGRPMGSAEGCQGALNREWPEDETAESQLAKGMATWPGVVHYVRTLLVDHGLHVIVSEELRGS